LTNVFIFKFSNAFLKTTHFTLVTGHRFRVFLFFLIPPIVGKQVARGVLMFMVLCFITRRQITSTLIVIFKIGINVSLPGTLGTLERL
jgi:hypothetical protein